MSSEEYPAYVLLMNNLLNQVLLFNKIYGTEVSVIISPSKVELKDGDRILKWDEIKIQ